MIDALSLLAGAASTAALPALPPPSGPNRGPVESTAAEVDHDLKMETRVLPAGVSIDLLAPRAGTCAFRGHVQQDSVFIFQSAIAVDHEILEPGSDASNFGPNDDQVDDDGDRELSGFVSITPTLSRAVADSCHAALALKAGISVQPVWRGAPATNRHDDTLVVGFIELG